MDRQLGRTLLVLLLCRIGNSTCPYKCQCFTELQVLCADERMSTLPRDISRQVREVIIMTSSLEYLFSHSLMESPQLTKLIFLNNALTSIHMSAFEHLTELLELELSGNPQLDHLYLGTFSKQEKLTKLLLNYNSLQTILPGLFHPLTQLEILQMRSNLLSDLPLFLFQNLGSLRVLDLSQNRIQEVTGETFSGLASLEILKMGNNLIGNLTSDTFHNISQLTELHLEWNGIAQLDDAVFSVLTNLSVLNLRGNRLTAFTNKVFGGEPTNLKELNLKGNRLTELSLDSLSSLTVLTLSDNQLSSLTENLFRNLTSLESLDMSGNQLTSLPEGIFKDLLSIEVINLHNNNLTELDSKLFQDQILLKRLYLSHNQLETLRLGLFDHFILRPKVRLHGNPWRCECQLWYLHEWLMQNLQDVELSDLVACERPDSLRKQTLVSISRDQLVCHLPVDRMPGPNSCSLQVSNDTVVVRCSVEKCSPLTVKVQFQEENGDVREHILEKESDKAQCSNETLRESTID
ncbi:carboxypeptidase N subunit 2-like [Poeciliopsis prolifica]|uniref:carboxypeptidase N subunit 2-like n=1 Tax=Poeciliopsis prolifica TaxID=188132 RepID=UPI002413A2D3|nr:carboxypeptidase N subunit 2-like [Poeciliopsis prolifica]XP_054889388.1 carboxypeptidase N subunit 2-like [Poeciliopsis prolifica]